MMSYILRYTSLYPFSMRLAMAFNCQPISNMALLSRLDTTLHRVTFRSNTIHAATLINNASNRAFMYNPSFKPTLQASGFCLKSVPARLNSALGVTESHRSAVKTEPRSI